MISEIKRYSKVGEIMRTVLLLALIVLLATSIEAKKKKGKDRDDRKGSDLGKLLAVVRV